MIDKELKARLDVALQKYWDRFYVSFPYYTYGIGVYGTPEEIIQAIEKSLAEGKPVDPPDDSELEPGVIY